MIPLLAVSPVIVHQPRLRSAIMASSSPSSLPSVIGAALADDRLSLALLPTLWDGFFVHPANVLLTC